MAVRTREQLEEWFTRWSEGVNLFVEEDGATQIDTKRISDALFNIYVLGREDGKEFIGDSFRNAGELIKSDVGQLAGLGDSFGPYGFAILQALGEIICQFNVVEK